MFPPIQKCLTPLLVRYRMSKIYNRICITSIINIWCIKKFRAVGAYIQACKECRQHLQFIRPLIHIKKRCGNKSSFLFKHNTSDHKICEYSSNSSSSSSSSSSYTNNSLRCRDQWPKFKSLELRNVRKGRLYGLKIISNLELSVEHAKD